MYKLAAEEGMGIDCVSGGELYTAKKAGFPAERIYFHGLHRHLPAWCLRAARAVDHDRVPPRRHAAVSLHLLPHFLDTDGPRPLPLVRVYPAWAARRQGAACRRGRKAITTQGVRYA